MALYRGVYLPAYLLRSPIERQSSTKRLDSYLHRVAYYGLQVMFTDLAGLAA